MCASALETVGLDPYKFFSQIVRAEIAALDMAEEFRSVMADRLC
ncbi:MAG: CRISPR-associated endonuclease Cas1 [Eisenbergiella massiliensis]